MVNGGGCNHGKLSEWRRYFLIPAILLILVPNIALAGEKPRDYFITFDLDKSNVYEGEAALATLTLHSREPKITYGEMLEAPGLEKGQFDFIRAVNSSSHAFKENIDGETFYSIPLKSFIVSIHDKGTYKLTGGKFKIGVVKRMTYDDPFWGKRIAERIVPVIVDVDPGKFKIKGLPTNPGGDFSGLVGDFKVSTILPPGDIVFNESATALIKISGKGLISEGVLPDYSKAFDKGVKLKSMSESRNIFFDGTTAVSELVLECEFIAISKDAEIGNIDIDFFNPSKGKFERVSSETVKINARSITSKIETIDI